MAYISFFAILSSLLVGVAVKKILVSGFNYANMNET